MADEKGVWPAVLARQCEKQDFCFRRSNELVERFSPDWYPTVIWDWDSLGFRKGHLNQKSLDLQCKTQEGYYRRT